jgi:plastocyanin
MFRTIALVALAAAFAAPAARADTHLVTQSGFEFLPRDLIVLVGDTVQWVHTGSSHTITNGTGAADPGAGSLFDAPLDSANPTFSYTFEQPAVVPYFCRPHEGFDMKGTVTVEAPVANESATWSRIKRIFVTG